MDTIMLKSTIMQRLVSQFLERTLRNKYGIDAQINLKDFDLNTGESDYHISVDGTMTISKSDFALLTTL